MMTFENYNDDLVELSDGGLMFEFAHAVNFDGKTLCNKRTRDETINNLLKSPAITTGSLKNKTFSKPIESKTRY